MRIKLLEYINYDKDKFMSRWESEGKPYIDVIGENGDGFIDWLETMDPSPKNKYVNWLIIRYLKGDIKRLEDIPSRISGALKKYISLGNKKKLKPEHRDINRIRDIEDVVDEYREVVDVTSKSEKKNKFISSGEAEIVFDDSEYSIIIPKTEEASCYFGTNTRWCTASRDNNLFDDYNSEGPLYIILHKPSNRRWQFHFPSGQYMDERDDEINIISFFKKHRKLFEIFKRLGKVTYDNGVFKTASDNYIRYYNDYGEIHRDDGPAVIYSDGTQVWYNNGEIHRDDGPAVIYPNGSVFWYKNGKLHRDDGPAVVFSDGTKQWWYNNELLSKDEWEEVVSKKSSTNENINRLKQLSGLSKN